MPIFEVEWEAKGVMSVEADDADEAEELVEESVKGFDSTMIESLEVNEVEIIDVTEESS